MDSDWKRVLKLSRQVGYAKGSVYGILMLLNGATSMQDVAEITAIVKNTLKELEEMGNE